MQGNLVDSVDWAEKTGAFVDDKKIDMSNEQEYRDVMLDKTRTVYKDDFGAYTTDESKASSKVTIDVDKTTGKVNVSAPSFITERASFQNEILPQLKNISQAYKQDPNYKFVNQKTGESEDIPTIISNIANALNDNNYKETARLVGQSVNSMRKLGFADADDSTAMIMWQNDIAMMPDAKDDTRVQLADLAINVFKDAESFDAASKTVSLKDFKEYYDRRKVSDDMINAVINSLDEYTSADDSGKLRYDMTAKEYAQSIAMLKMLKGTSPAVGVLQGIADVIVDFGTGIFDFTANTVTNAGLFVSDVIEKIGGGPVSEDQSSKKVWGDLQDWLNDNFDKLEEREQYLNHNAAVAIGLGEMFAGLGFAITAGNIAGGVVGGAVGSLGGKVVTGANVAKNAITTGNKIDATVSIMNASLKLNTAANAAKTFNAANKVINGISTGSSILADSVASAVVFDPQLTSKIIRGTDNPSETTKYLMDNLMFDAVAFGATKGAAKVFSKAGSSTTGQLISYNKARRMNKFASVVGDFKDGIRVTFSKYDDIDTLIANIKNPDKKSAAKARQALLSAQRTLGNAEAAKWIGASAESKKAMLKNAVDAIMDVRATNNAVDILQRGVKGEFSEMVNNTTVAQPFKAFSESQQKLIKLDTLGVHTVKHGGETYRIMSKTTANYISAKKQLEFYTNKLGSDVVEKISAENLGGLSKGEATTIQDLKDKIQAFTNVASPELLSAADNYYKSLETLSNSIVDYASQFGVISKADLDDWRNSGLWGNGHFRTQRVGQEPTVRVTNLTGEKNVKTVVDPEKYRVGSTEDFVDPFLVVTDRMYDVASSISRIKAANLLKSTNAFKFVKMADGTMTEATKKASAQKINAFIDEVSVNTKKAVKNKIDSADFLGKKLFRSNIEAAEKAKQDIELKAAAVKRKNYSISKASRQDYIMSADSAQIGELMNSVNGQSSLFDDCFMENGQGNLFTNSVALDPTKLESKFLDMDENTIRYINNEMRKMEDVYAGSFADFKATKKITNVVDGKKVTRTIPDPESFADIADDAFIGRIDRKFLSSNDSIVNGEEITELVMNQKRELRLAELRTQYAEQMKRIQSLQKDYGLAEVPEELLMSSVDDAIDDIVEKTTKSNSQVIDGVLDVSGDSGDIARSYVAMRTLVANADDFEQAVYDKALKDFDSIIGRSDKSKKLASEYSSMAKERLLDRFDELEGAMAETGSPLVDQDKLFSEVDKLNKDIAGYKSDKNNFVALGNNKGQLEYFKVSPTVASLINTTPSKEIVTSSISEFNYFTSKLFRLGTTGLRVKSWVMQTFRDSFNNFIGGGLFMTMGRATDEMTDLFGERVANELRESAIPFERQLVKSWETAGEDVGRKSVEYLIQTGKNLSPAATETVAYTYRLENSNLRFGKNSEKERGLVKLNNFMDNLTEAEYINIGGKKIKNPMHLNQSREELMRDMAYANALNDGLKRGYTTKQAKIYATQIMNEAGTNFSRKMYHFSSFQKSVPYLGAAINGQKSFYRLLSLDPVGVLGRLTGGVVIPTVALTGASLMDPDSKETYRQIPEYEKRDNMIFVINGIKISIPLPQEIAGMTAPFRTFIEKMYDGNDKDFYELMANNAIGLQPFNLQGFIDIDGNRFKDITIWDRVVKGFSQLSSQLMPPVVKSAVIAATGYDPYTGKYIGGSTYSYVDPVTGEQMTMDYTSGEFSKTFSRVFGGKMNPALAEKMLSSIISTTGIDILDSITGWGKALLSGGKEGTTPLDTFKKTGADIAGALVSVEYDRQNKDWKDNIRDLWREKDALMQSDEYKSVNDNLRNAKTAEDRENAMKGWHNLMDPFIDKVKYATDKLVENDSMAYTNYKFASVLSLMNFSGITNLGTDAESRIANTNAYYKGQREAIATMQELGFSGTGDLSIFGKLVINKEGEVGIQYSNPIEILNFENMVYNSGKMHAANIEEIANTNKLSASSARSQISAIYDSKNKLSDADYDKIDAIRIEHNSKVLKALLPYVQQYGVDAVTSSDDVNDYIEDIILVPSEWMVDKKGKYISSPNLDKNTGYAKSYFKAILKEALKEK